jgi:hypothetical protein
MWKNLLEILLHKFTFFLISGEKKKKSKAVPVAGCGGL